MKKNNSIILFIKENQQLLIAILFSMILLIGAIIAFFVFLPKDNSNVASDGELNSYETTVTEEYLSDCEDETNEVTEDLCDEDYTNPNEANEPTEETMKDEEYPYLVKVNRLLNCVTVYTKDSKGNFTVPYKSMACSTGKNRNNTPLGTFHTSSKYAWRKMVDGTHSQYAYRIEGGILFHSIPCYSPSKNQLEVEEFNKLGSPASLGCVRLTVADAKWIYDNCPYGTTVIIYDDASNPGPLGKPSVIKIPIDSENAGWDPTDPDYNNPWRKLVPSIEAYDNITSFVGEEPTLLKGVVAYDTCGNDITSNIEINGYYDINTPGTYNITYSVTDLLSRSAKLTITLNIEEKIENVKDTQVYTNTMPVTEETTQALTEPPTTTTNTPPKEQIPEKDIPTTTLP